MTARLSSVIRRPVAALRRKRRLRRFAASTRSNDVFVVTFPKSGTTWVAYFLALVLSDRSGADPGRLDLSSCREWVPDINDHYFKGRPLTEFDSLAEPRVFTLHAPLDPALSRVIYVVRDPRDVAVSYFYQRLRKKLDLALDLSEYVEEFVAEDSIWPSGWSDHVGGWLGRQNEAGFRLVRYEDLKRRPIETFGTILESIGIDLPSDEIRPYVEMASFEEMSKLEKPKSEARQAGPRFIRRGEAGGWREDLGTAQARLIEDRYGDLMLRLGYELSQ